MQISQPIFPGWFCLKSGLIYPKMWWFLARVDEALVNCVALWMDGHKGFVWPFTQASKSLKGDNSLQKLRRKYWERISAPPLASSCYWPVCTYSIDQSVRIFSAHHFWLVPNVTVNLRKDDWLTKCMHACACRNVRRRQKDVLNEDTHASDFLTYRPWRFCWWNGCSFHWRRSWLCTCSRRGPFPRCCLSAALCHRWRRRSGWRFGPVCLPCAKGSREQEFHRPKQQWMFVCYVSFPQFQMLSF